MKFIFIILIPFALNSQSVVDRWNSLPSETKNNIDHTFDWWSRAITSWGISEITYHYTDRRFLSAMCGLAVGVGTAFLERGMYGKVVSIGGAIGGDMAFGVRWDIKDRKHQDYYEKRKSIESIKEQFNNL